MPAEMLDSTDAILNHVEPRSFLVATWEGGGNMPPVLSIIRKLISRGHNVRMIGDSCQRAEAEEAGASFSAWQRVAPRPDKSAEFDPIKDWEVKSPPELLGRLRDRLFIGPALAYARDVLEELQRFPADAVLTSEMLLGVMVGAEAAGVPCVALCSNVYLYPLPGVPPFGPGFQPRRGLLGLMRDTAVCENCQCPFSGRERARLMPPAKNSGYHHSGIHSNRSHVWRNVASF